jgi:hypothetical protein
MERWRASSTFGPPHNMLPTNNPMCIKALVLYWDVIAIFLKNGKALLPKKCNLLGKASNFCYE